MKYSETTYCFVRRSANFISLLSSNELVMRNFQQLECWKRGHQLTLLIYKTTRFFPFDERFGITSQMRRASSSIPTNIAEGCGRSSKAELNRFLFIAAGSSSELQYQVLLCRDLTYITDEQYKELTSEIIQIRKMIYGYAEKLSQHQ